MSAAIALVFPALLIACAASDLVRFEIPNGWPVALLAGYAGYAFVSGASWAAVGTDVAAGAAVLIAGMILFRFGLLGGGDVKTLAAATPWVGWPGLPEFLLWVALWGGALAVLLVIGRRLADGEPVLGPRWWRRLWAPDSGVPYGVAICAGGLTVWPNFIGPAGLG